MHSHSFGEPVPVRVWEWLDVGRTTDFSPTVVQPLKNLLIKKKKKLQLLKRTCSNFWMNYYSASFKQVECLRLLVRYRNVHQHRTCPTEGSIIGMVVVLWEDRAARNNTSRGQEAKNSSAVSRFLYVWIYCWLSPCSAVSSRLQYISIFSLLSPFSPLRSFKRLETGSAPQLKLTDTLYSQGKLSCDRYACSNHGMAEICVFFFSFFFSRRVRDKCVQIFVRECGQFFTSSFLSSQ